MSKTATKARLDMCQAFSKFIDNGSQSATIIFYEGALPASTETTANQDLKLVTLTLPKPSVKEVTSSYVELHPTDLATVIKTGTATWARVYCGTGEVAADLTVGTDISLASTHLALGGTLTITSIKLRP